MFGETYKGKNVLITGATGFKGSWLSLWLTKLGANVSGYSLAPKSENDNYVKCGVEKIINHKTANIQDFETLQKFIKDIQPEFVFHLAAQPLVIESYKNTRENYLTNVIGTVNLFEALRKVDHVKVVVNVTTDKVYKNDNNIWAFREEDKLEGGDPYSASKSCSDIITKSYNYSFFEDKGIRTATARAGNVIGAGDWAENRIVPDFFRALTRKQVLELRNPMSTRPWQHVLDPLYGYLVLAESLYKSDKYVGGWNFGPYINKDYTVGDLVDQFTEYFPDVSILKNSPANSFKEANLLKLDITKAVTYLDWRPILDFSSIIKYTAKGYLADLEGLDVLENRMSQIESFMNSI